MNPMDAQRADQDTPLYNEIYPWAEDLFPICRSITGDGVRETLRYIRAIVPELIIREVPSATQAFLKAEFTKEGRMHDHARIDGEWVKDITVGRILST